MSVKILGPHGALDTMIREQPNHRISKAQKDSLLEIGKKDPRGIVDGLDSRMHPVVSAKMPNGPTHYALDRAGTCTAVKLPLIELW